MLSILLLICNMSKMQFRNRLMKWIGIKKKVYIPKRGSGEAVLKFLHQNSLKPEHRRSIKEINKYIEQERNAWE